MKILITRPAHQAQALCDKLVAIGHQVILFPTIEIKEIIDKTLIRKQIQLLEQQNLVIFISPNAVQKAIPIINNYYPTWPFQVKIAAIGASTTKALHQHNLNVDVFPTNNFNSEAFLALPELQNIADQKIIIFRGIGGRELLADTLRIRGAHVTEIEVYQRAMPDINMANMDWQKHGIDIIVCTSNTGLQNLHTMANETQRAWLLHAQLLVISNRIAELAKTLGFVKSPLVADNATDEEIIYSLKNYASSISPFKKGRQREI